MKCPICSTTAHVEIDTHSDGFAENLQECGECGTVWTVKGERVIVVHSAPPAQAVNQ